MRKSLRHVWRALRKPAVSLCLSAGLLSINSERASAQCYALRLASNTTKYLTSADGLRVRTANNQANQIFRFESVGEYVRITPHGSIYEGANALTRRWDDAVVTAFLYRGNEGQLWRQKSTGNGTVGFIQKDSNMGFGSTYNWGEGDPSAVSDINMVPESDVDIYGANKWTLIPKTCPASSGACDFNITLTTSNSNPQLNVPFTLTAHCTGSGCSGVAYEWAGNGQETGIYGNPQTVTPQFAGQTDYTVIASKDGSGCTYRSAHLRLNVQSGARMGVDETVSQNESKPELQVFPNPSKGEFEVELYLEKGEPADLTVTNVAGQILQKRSVVGKGVHREKFDIGNSAPGMYLFNLIKRDKVEVKKMLINK
jgi:hypothetical protein